MDPEVGAMDITWHMPKNIGEASSGYCSGTSGA